MRSCVCGCGRRAVQEHHVVTRQELRRRGGSVRDMRNLVPVADVCHGRHHSKFARLPLSVLPDSVFEFAEELMGADAAWVYLRRHYGGADPRLDQLTVEGA